MVVAVPLLGDRVAPRCTTANRLLLVQPRAGFAASKRLLPVQLESAADLLQLIQVHNIDLLVCGGITAASRELVEAQNVTIIDNVTGSVEELLAAISGGSLRSGLGFGNRSISAHPLEHPFDCLACANRVCENGAACPQVPTDLLPEPPDRGGPWFPRAALPCQWSARQGLCRVAELVRFARASGVSTLGLAFCRDLREETEILARLLRRFFQVVPISCVVSGRARPPGTATCDPLLQAHLLNLAGAEINVLVGLCVGADCVFAAASRAPVSTLFAKDTALAHNPIAAIRSEYYLRQCLEAGATQPADPGTESH